MGDDEKSVTQHLVQSLSDRQCVLLEISVKLHSFLNHSMLEEDEEKEDGVTIAADNTASKFVNEMDGGAQTQTQRQSTKMDDLLPILERGGASKADCGAVSRWFVDEQMDTDSMEYDLSILKWSLMAQRTLDDDDLADSNFFLVLNGDRNERRRIMKQMVFRLEALNPFTFGFCTFFHYR